jgi:RND family efflux transporter MFP subunit
MNKVLLNVAIASSILMAACSKKQPPASPEVPVNLAKVKAKKVLFYDKYPATATALMQVNLLPEVQGAITGIFFKEGGHVKKGQKLYEIDKRIYEAAYDQAVANLKVSQGTLVQSQQDADRYAYLNKYNAVAKQLYDHAVITLENSKNTVRASEQAVRSAKTNLGYATVYAPFDGTIGISQVRLGNVVSVGSTVLNTISTDDPMAVDFIITEKELPKYEKMRLNPHPIDSLFTITLPDNSIYNETGKLYIIDRAVDTQTGTITVRLVFPNKEGILRAGMSLNVRVHNQDKAPQIVVPNKAVVEQMGEYFVFVARDTMVNNPKEGADSAKKKMKQLRAVEKKVMTGQVIGPNIIIKSGVDTGERIITDGVQTLHDGSPITTANKIGPGGGGKGGR